MAIQQQTRVSFGTGRIYYTAPGALNTTPLGKLMEVNVDVAIEVKDIYSEGQFAFAVASGRKAIKMQGKHYEQTLNSFQALDFAGNSVASGATPFQIDEVQLIATGTATLSKGATLVAGSGAYEILLASNLYVPLTIVVAGSEAIGVSASISAIGVLTFKTGETATKVRANYQYVDAANGQTLTIANLAQNSDTTFKMVLVKRDTNPLDNSTGYLIATFNAVKSLGNKFMFKEGDFTVYDRSFQAFADLNGNIGSFSFVNE